jgi:hypothetical protein
MRDQKEFNRFHSFPSKEPTQLKPNGPSCGWIPSFLLRLFRENPSVSLVSDLGNTPQTRAFVTDALGLLPVTSVLLELWPSVTRVIAIRYGHVAVTMSLLLVRLWLQSAH